MPESVHLICIGLSVDSHPRGCWPILQPEVYVGRL